METQRTAESGFGFLARLASKPRFLNIETKLFPNGLLSKQTVEICGDTSTSKTLLLSQLMTKCLLPPAVGGLGVKILLFNTDHHFLMIKLFTLMSGILKNNWGKSDDEADEMIRDSLSNLTIINCYNYSQLMVSLHSLDLILLRNGAVSLMMMDSISSFYWVHRERNGLCSLEHYVKGLLKIVQKHTLQANVSLIYTKSCETGFTVRERINCTTEPIVESINHRIILEIENREFNCRVETSREQENMRFRITDDGIQWL
ncbi:DNA repair protein XRCC2-like [Diachasmimorpha longicaudata]|uniref:DNA repair protein XRCC2-like n=1 Tax=Diachasmimorpha longicaudata TaxID=58733 RepID=UPI0030B8C441